ncbi:Hsp70 family protein [Streptomyces sp. NPDC001933]|uniref:Hsp70 family protein n=1 Tax=Streptomyces sp. NPDC001933 TaxID=3364626 RepID=UPI0036A1CB2C
MIAIDLGHRFGRVARMGPDGLPEVTTTRLVGVDGVLDPVRALPLLLDAAVAEGTAVTGETAVLGLPVAGGREDELRYAVEQAGLGVGRVVPESVAVALHYGAIAEGVDHTVLVCDQGATTLDLSVLTIAPDLTVHVVRAVSLRNGGDDWDAAIAAVLTGRLPDGADPLGAAETVRRALDTSDGVTVPLSMQGTTGERHALALDPAAAEGAVAPLRERALAAVRDQLAAAEPAVDTVLLAGGMCASPRMRAGIEALPAAGGMTVRCDRPDRAVALGLFALRDFGVLRVVAGPAAGPGRPEAGYAGPGSGYPYVGAGNAMDPEPAVTTTDPEPRAGRTLPEDPEPGSWQGGASAAEDKDTGGRGSTAPEAEAPGRPDPEQSRPDPSYADPSYAEPAHAEPPRLQPPHAEPPRPRPSRPEPSYADPGPCEPGHDEPPHIPAQGTNPAPESPSPPVSGPYDTTAPTPAPTPTGSPIDPPAHFAIPVDQLQVVRRGDHLLVLWAWPDGALSARVRWRREGGGTGAAAPAEGDVVCRRRVYEHDGGFDLAVGREAVTLTVEALVAELSDGCEGASSLLVPAAPTVVAYEPSVRRRLRGRVASVSFTSETGCDLPALRIVHSLGRFRPTSTSEGTVLHEVPAQRLAAGTPLTVEFPLPATRGPSWLVCFPASEDTETGTDTGTGAGTDSGIDIRPAALHRLRVT